MFYYNPQKSQLERIGFIQGSGILYKEDVFHLYTAGRKCTDFFI